MARPIWVACQRLLDGDAHPGETGTPVSAYTTREAAEAASALLHIVQVPLNGDTRLHEVYLVAERLGDDFPGKVFGVYASAEKARAEAGEHGMVLTMPVFYSDAE